MVLKPKKRYKSFIIVLIIWSLIALNWENAEAIEFTDFGPYRGTVVDADTKEPIEGVVILVEWSDPPAQILRGGTILIDAQETVTNSSGEFYISGIWVFNPLKRLTAGVAIYIYKSGYQAIKTVVWKKWPEFEASIKGIKYTIEDGKPVFLLKRLATIEERRRFFQPSHSHLAPYEKQRLLLQEIKKERKFLGLDEKWGPIP